MLFFHYILAIMDHIWGLTLIDWISGLVRLIDPPSDAQICNVGIGVGNGYDFVGLVFTNCPALFIFVCFVDQ